jgi:molybdopterin converting factor small subunit
MQVTVHCFARLREIVGQGVWTCEVRGPATIADVWRALITEWPAAAAMTRAVSCARNADFAAMSTAVEDGDEVAFLPPVSGGAFGDR